VPGNQTLTVGGFDLRLENVVLPIGLTVDRVELTGNALHVESEPLAVRTPQPSALQAFIGEKSLESFLERQAPAGLRNFKVRLADDKLRIEATKTVLIDVRAVAHCKLRVVDGRQLFVDLISVDAFGVGITNLIQSQIDKINPILDVRDFPIEATLSRVEISDGILTAHGRVSPPERLVK